MEGSAISAPGLGRWSFFCPSSDSSLLASGRSRQLFRNWKPSTTGAQEVIMISPGPSPSPALARWAESYEAKCERRQEIRESRCCRPNVTTCRQLGRALRTQHREHLQRARQQQFFRRRNLEVEEKGQAQHPQAREKGPSRKPGGGTGQAVALKEPLSCVNRISFPGQQVSCVQRHTALWDLREAP
jgi:hypothetical protein